MPNTQMSYSRIIDLDDMTVEDFLAIALKAIQIKKWEIDTVGSRKIVASTTITPVSAGELIVITMPGSGTAEITSSSKGTETPPGSRNHQNVEDFLNTFDEIAAEISPEETVKLKKIYMASINEKLAKNEVQYVTRKGLQFDNVFSIFNPVEGYFITPLLLIINVAVFIFMVFTDIANFLLPDAGTLLKWGANYYPSVVSGEYYRLITSCFIHIGFLHLVINMFALVVTGAAIERLMGKFSFLSAYLITGVFANLITMQFNHNLVTAGATGAIFGILGIYAVLSAMRALDKRPGITFIVSVSLFLLYSIAAGIFYQFTTMSSIVSGLFAGLVTGLLFYPTIRVAKPKGFKYGLVFLLACLVVILAERQVRISGLTAVDEPVVLQNSLPRYNSDIFQMNLKDILDNENRAVNIVEARKDMSKRNFLKAMKDSAFYFWNENITLLDDLKKFKWNDDYRNVVEDLNSFCCYQKKFYELLYWKVRENTDKYDSLLNYYRRNSEEVAEHINMVHGS